MTTLNDMYEAGVDAIIADNTLNRNGFEDALKAVVTTLNNADADQWVTELIDEYFRLDGINNQTYNSFRSRIISDGKTLTMELFKALETAVNTLATTPQVREDINLMNLRIERDEVDTSITTMQGFKPGQTAQVRDALNVGIDALRIQKERLRDEIRTITGDPDSL